MNNFMERYCDWVIAHKKLTLGILALITVFFATQLLSLQINPSLFLLGKDHEGRIHMANSRTQFTGSGEQILVGIVAKEDSVFNSKSLLMIQQLTQQFAELSLVNENDADRLQAAAIDETSKALVQSISADRINHNDAPALRNLLAHFKATPGTDLKVVEYVADLLVRAAPVIRIRSLADIENIELDEEGALDVHELIKAVPQDEKSLKALAAEVFDNPLFIGSIVSEEGKASVIQIELSIDEEDSRNLQRAYGKVLELVDSVKTQDSFHIGGTATYYAAITYVVEKDNNTFFPFVVLVISLLLYLSFRRWQGVWIPLLVSVLSLVWTLGVVSLAGFKLNIITNMIPVFIISIAVADSIHLLATYYERLKKGDKDAAIRSTLKYLLVPMLMTSVTTFFGFVALSLTNLTFIREFGIFVAIGVVFAFIITITLLPALLPLLKLPKEVVARRTDNQLMELIDRFGAFANSLSKSRPGLLLTASALVLAITVYSGLQVKVDNENINSFSQSTRVRQDNDVLNQYVGGTVPVSIWLKSESDNMVKRPEYIKAMRLIQERLKSHKQIGYTISPVDYLNRIHELMSEDSSKTLPADASEELISQYFLLYEFGDGAEIKDVVDYTYRTARVIGLAYTDKGTVWQEIVKDIQNYAKTVVPEGVTVHVYGTGELQASNIPEIITSQIYSFALSFIVLSLVMTLLFRSFTLGLIGMLPMIFTLACIGTLMAILGITLDIGSAMICGICFGVGIDYTIHFLSAYKTYWLDLRDQNQALSKTLTSVSRPIVINSLTLAFGFAVLCLSSYAAIINLGLLVAASMIICAVVTLVLIPALIRVLKQKTSPNTEASLNEPALGGEAPDTQRGCLND